MRSNPISGQTWLHYKGGKYVIICDATDAETGDPVVVYRSEQDGRLYTRTLARFMSTVPEQNNVNRFEQTW